MRERVCVCVPLPLCMVPVAPIITIFVYSRFERTLDTIVPYTAAFHGCLFNLVYLLLERAIASAHGAPAPLNF